VGKVLEEPIKFLDCVCKYSK